MTALLTSAQMRAVEAAAIASGRVTGLELMERAGRGVVEAVFAEWPALAAGSFRAVVLCGPGNNGGDGFVVARLLKEWGWAVSVYLYGDADSLPPDARLNYERWVRMGAVAPWGPPESDDPDAVLIVDAVFGTGLARPLPPDISRTLALFSMRPGPRTRIVAVDAPSGLCMDSGRPLGDGRDTPATAFAQLTVSFHAEKLGHRLAAGPQHCGKVVVCDIGLDPAVEAEQVRLVDEDWLRDDPIPHLSKWHMDHKFSNGHALILSGGVGRGGAARLAARGALRIGAGLVTVGCPPSALIENAARLDAVMLRKVKDGAALAGMLAGDARISALCLGPGLGLGAREAGLLRAVLEGADGHAAFGGALVLDADALTLLAGEAGLFALLHDRCVLTPHGGEFARLFPDIADRLAAPATRGPVYSKVDAVRAAAARAGCVVLFKGPDTVIAAASGHCAVHSAAYDRAAPGLATAGSGDVLAGFITGLMARGFGPMQAAETAAWLHVDCARNFGPGLIAEDLPEALPPVFRALGL